jgi:hypothetical protein
VPLDLFDATQISAGGFLTVALTSGFSDCDGDGANDLFQITSSHTLDLNRNLRPDSCDIADGTEQDCDTDGRVDWYELNVGDEFDFNFNGQLDACDIALGWEEDCDLNRMIDSWQQQLNAEILVESAQMGPIGYGSPQTATLFAPPFAISDPVLRLAFRGDFSSAAEHVTVYLNGRYVGRLLDINANYTDCTEYIGAILGYNAIEIPREFFNDAIWSGSGPLDANLEFVASIAVNANQCPSGSWIKASLSYTASITADCNANGLLDVCETRDYPETDLDGNGIVDACQNYTLSFECPGDLDASGSVDPGDLSLLLLNFGLAMPGDPNDIDGSGIIDNADIGFMLLFFGPCN